MAAVARLRSCLPAAAAAAAATQAPTRPQKHARTEGSALLQWRSSRVAPQSVDGRPVADVREGGGAVSRLYGVSRRGYAPYDRAKRNQDALRVLKDERTDTQAILVLDGHGEYGEEVSRRFADKFLEAVTKHPFWATNIERACREELARLEGEILADSSIDCAFSGTTVAFAAVRRNQVFWCNVGDSRITLGVCRDGVIRAEPLTTDHKPETPEEKARIERCGGRVFALEYDDGIIGPPRVWLPDADVPGLAMSRSVGDQVAHAVGVSSEPDCGVRRLSPDDKFLVAATDGLWEFLPNAEVVARVAEVSSQSGSPRACVDHLVREATARWLAHERVVDDTTVCVAFLEASPPD